MGLLFLLGTLTGLERNYYAIFAIIVLVAINISNFRHLNKRRAIRFAFVLSGILILAGLLAYQTDVVYQSQKEYIENKNKISVSGRVYKKEFKNEKLRLYLKDVRGEEGSLFSLLIFSDEEVTIGSLIEVTGSILLNNAPDNEGEFDYSKYLKSQKIVGSLVDCDISVISESKVQFFEYLYDLRENVKEFYRENLPGEESGLLSSIVLGDKTELDKEASDLFRKAGLSHILAISGLHLSIVGSLLYRFLRRRGVGFLGAGIVSSLAVLLYGLFAGNPISLIRALAMFLIVLVGNVLGRADDMLNSLSIVMLGFLINNPFVVYNTGFALSFLIILGICLVSKPMSEYYNEICKERFRKKNPDFDEEFKLTPKEKLVSSLISGFGIWTFSVPILAIYFNEIPVYVVILNLVVLPVLGVLLLLGLLSGLFTIPIGLIPCHYILYYYEVVASFFTKLPGSTLTIAHPSVWNVIWYYSVLLAMVYVLMNVSSAKSVVLYFTIPFILTATLKLTSFPSGFRIDMLSVGQGDGIYFQSGDNISFFVDGGSSSEKNLGEYTLLPYFKYSGLSHIDYWILTHLDDDHMNGFVEILEKGYRVDNLILSKSIEKGEVLSNILKLCAKNNTRVSYVIPGDYIETKDTRIDFLYPYYPPKREGGNENSLVFLLSYKDCNALFTGDMGTAEEEDLLNSNQFRSLIGRSDLEFLKVAHHGSKNSSSKEWLKFLSPDYALISVGKNSRYGHPHKETLERIRGFSPDSKVLRTDEVGQIRIRVDDRKLKNRKTHIDWFIMNAEVQNELS